MRPLPVLVPSAILVLCSAVPAQGTPFLLADAETGSPSNAGAFYEPKPGVSWGAYVYFAADADGRGNELWRTTGAVGNAELVADLNVAAGSEPEPIGVLGGWLLFVADDGASGRELWRTTGVPGNASLVVDLVPGAAGSDPREFVRYGNWYYFLGGEQLWKTDGTGANTIAVGTPVPGATDLVASGSQLWIAADDGGTWKLWSSDGGSSVGFVAALPGEPTGLTGLPGIHLVFACDDGNHGPEPWHSTGTAAGTQLLVDLLGGAAGSYPESFTAFGSVVCFRAHDGFSYRLWRTDGTAVGTWSIDTGNGPRNPEWLTACGSRLYFRAQDGAGQNAELWTSNGTAGGTLQVADIWPGTPSSGASGFAFDGAQWTYFSANDGSTGYELWRTDGTVAQRCSDVQPGVHDSFPVVLGFAGGSCVFTALHGPNAVELYRSQGTASQLVRDLRRGDNGSSAPQHITAQADGRFFFSGVRGALGREAWFSDGSPGSALFLVDTYAGSVGGLGPSTRAASWQNYTFFNNLPGSRLWRTAGTVPSTNQIPNVQVAYADLVPFAGKLYFDASTMATGEELWMLDSPLVAPVLLKDAMPGGGGSIRELTVAGNRLFFSAQDPTSQPGYGNLWVSDGTPAGTQRVFTHGLPGTEPQFLRAFGRQVVFSLGLAPQLWISDGTAAGSVPLGSFAGNHERVVAGDRLFLAGEVPGGGTGVELFVCDGAAITLVKDVRPGSASSDLYGLCAFGDGVLFVADDGVHGFELWKSDGTAAGTQLVIDLRPGAASSCPPSGWNGTTGDGFVHAPGGAARAVFVADDGATGMELWRTDGTAAGTALLADLQPGRLGSWPGKPARCGAQLVFAATQTEAAAPVGRELFAMPAMATAEPVGSPCAAALADVPLARGVGAPALGNAAFALRVSGTPNTLAVLALGFPADQSQAPCEVRFANPLFTLVTVTSAQGQGQLGAGIPGSPAFAGLRLTAQWGVFENGGPYLGVAALSNGVDLVIAAQ